MSAGVSPREACGSMRSFFAKCVVIGIVAGGFTLTGDLARLADRGRRVLEAHTVPGFGGAEASPMDHPAAPGQAVAAPAPEPVTAAAAMNAQPSGPSADTRTAGSLAPIARPVPPPASGPERIDLATLSPGRRVLIWVRHPRGPRPARIEVLAFDIIDPASGEALEHSYGEPAAPDAPPIAGWHRRVVVGRSTGGTITKGGPLTVVPILGINGTGPEETLGIVAAIDREDH